MARESAAQSSRGTPPWTVYLKGCFCGSASSSRSRSRSATPRPDPRRRGSRPGCRSPSRPSSPRRPRPTSISSASSGSDFISVLRDLDHAGPLQPTPRGSCPIKESPLSSQRRPRRSDVPRHASLRRPNRGTSALEERPALVLAEDVAHRAADLADRGVGARAPRGSGAAGCRRRGRRRAAPRAWRRPRAWSRSALNSFSRSSWRRSASGSTLRMSTSSTVSVTYLLTPTMMSWPLL